jgi:hypothetical protein
MGYAFVRLRVDRSMLDVCEYVYVTFKRRLHDRHVYKDIYLRNIEFQKRSKRSFAGGQ